MTRLRIATLAVLAAAAAAFGALWLRPDAPRFDLLTEAEVIRRQSLPGTPERAISVKTADGPAIRVAAPQGFALVSPVDFDIRVEPRDGVAVDMASITIEYRLGPAWVNLTRRVMKHASVRGTRLTARGADLPAGSHALRVSVRDVDRRLTRAMVKFTVKGG